MPFGLSATEATEDQLKAVFVFNFLQFVQWPAAARPGDAGPMVIGVLDDEPLARLLDEAVRDEQIDGKRVEVRRYDKAGDVRGCHILFIGGANTALFRQAIEHVGKGSTLTVSDHEESAANGAMIQLATRDNRIRLLVNLESARAAGLTISSNLLRPAQIVRRSR